ncbi:PAN/Apple domain-containing protein [Thermovibrio ammonificans]|uniref:Uncharacterized protein n=1 Tax=Thermovibrio ammonificans (strain DSM 15698 / JCM 12110 / HB-1) TaxID=648996 RepID=E8T233_THEA1|nr:hypothetical protein [Thermovibrio ammonificans]ADU96928.1 hypothetical protein Theam_0961 [Thermovibrio ammonificans HB-1]
MIKEGLKAIAVAVLLSSTALGYPLELKNTARTGYTLARFTVSPGADGINRCKQLCYQNNGCLAWSVSENVCSLQFDVPEPLPRKGSTSGIKPAYLYPFMDTRIPESWGKTFKVVLCNPHKIPNSNQHFGWKEKAEAIGDAVPPEGAQGVLYLYPVTKVDPAVVEGTFKVPENGATLEIRTAGNVNSSYLLKVAVNGKVVLSKTVSGSRWRVVKVPLDSYAGQTVTVDLLGCRKGWFYQYIFIDWIKLVPND